MADVGIRPEAPTSSDAVGGGDARSPGPGSFLVAACLVVALIGSPFLLVGIPPIHDLPQHLAQTRLYDEVAGVADSPYRIRWLAPQLLIYVILLPLWRLLPAVAAGKTFSFLLLAGTAAALFYLAYRRRRAVEAGLIAGLLLLNFLFYAGFFAFQLGAALFFVWLAGWGDETSPRRWLLRSAQLALLGWAHAMWLAFASLLVGARFALVDRTRDGLLRLTTLVPALAWVVPSILSTMRARALSDLPMGPLYSGPSLRIGPPAWVDGPLGAVKGWIEPAVLVLIALWIVMALRAPGGRARRDGLLLGAAGLAAALWLVLPDSFGMTVQASRRWLPYGLMLLILGLPRPELPRRHLRAAGLAAYLALVGVSAAAWRFYDRAELAGFQESVAAIPERSRLLGLSFLESEHLKGGVFNQTYAWAEVLRGARLNTSFTEFGAGIVLLDRPRDRAWTRFLDWFPWTVRFDDFQHFDYVLVSGDPTIHRQFAGMGGLSPVTDTAPWRLYRVVADGEPVGR